MTAHKPKTKRPWRRRWLIIIITAIVACLLGVAGYWYTQSKHSSVQPATAEVPTEPASAKQPAKPSTPARIRLIVTGDELPHGAIVQSAKTADGYNFAPFFEQVKPVMQSADIRFCNQEAVSAGEAYGISGYPAFNAPKQFAANLHDVGCNVISLANNHMYDKGFDGIRETRVVWDGLKPFAVAGANRSAEEQAVSYFEVQGVRFAFVAYTEISNRSGFEPYMLNMLRDDLVTRQLTDARSKADVVLVSVHWGTEYSDGINAAQDQWARRFAELGADVVIGTGPHVLQPVKKLPRSGGGETVVWYSLGNLLSAQLDVPSLIGGFGVVDIDPATKKPSLAGFLPTYMHYEWTPTQKAAEDLNTRTNFKLYLLEDAVEPLKRSQNNTTADAQFSRVKSLLNTYTDVPIFTREKYFER